MAVNSSETGIAAPERVPLNDFVSVLAPAGWDMSVRLARSPHRSAMPPVITFRPQDDAEIALKSWVIDWLERQPELQALHEVLAESGPASMELVSRMFPALLRIPFWLVTHAEVVDHAGLGSILIVDYDRPDTWEKGRILYAASPTGDFDVQVISYEGKEPGFSAYVIDALAAIESIKTTVEQDEPTDFLEDLLS